MNIGLLFVCMGNICRSPTAQGVAESVALELDLRRQLTIDSAGTHGYHIGGSPDVRSIEAAAKRGIDIRNQRARQISRDDWQRFEYIVAMDTANFDLLRQHQPSPSQAQLIMLTINDTKQPIVVPDPYYGGEDGFEEVLDILIPAVGDLLRTIASRHNLMTTTTTRNQ